MIYLPGQLVQEAVKGNLTAHLLRKMAVGMTVSTVINATVKDLTLILDWCLATGQAKHASDCPVNVSELAVEHGAMVNSSEEFKKFGGLRL